MCIFILDLCIIMPALAIVAYQLLRNRPFGNVLAGVVLINIVALVLSVFLAELIAPLLTGNTPNYGMAAIYGSIVLISLILGVIYLRQLSASSQEKSID